VEGHDGGQLERAHEVEDRVAVVAAPDRWVPLDRDDVRAVLQRAGGTGVVGALVTPDPVVDLEGVRRDRLDGVERDDLAVGGDPAQRTGERGDAALARGIGRDERDAGDGAAPIERKAREKNEERPVTDDGPLEVPLGRGGDACRSVYARGARALGALLDVELDLLTAGQAVEIEGHVERAAMEEILLAILGGDKAKSAVGNDLLDCSGGHEDLLYFPNKGGRTHGPFEKVGRPRGCVTRGDGLTS